MTMAVTGVDMEVEASATPAGAGVASGL
jgi:hypothetical protein